ncbi:phage protein [Secundilactobacillus pentosiphilus]|uniref:Phage protein n=1 Tax=Secundilactobacillus pentosiphilus TaxID=1714682 RepID=A0A1Z5IUL1_9LACO|nr:phage tail domain-containing protein [Secundilactobacillus pentosiphilus]GAX05366.1 phage protein [Secundilactobacillus pentosiphilus]
MEADDLLVKHEGMPEFAMSNIPGLVYLGLSRPSPTPATNYQTFPTHDGEVQYGDVALGPLTMNAKFYLESETDNEFKIKQQELFDQLFDRRLIQVRESLRPGIVADCVMQTFDFDTIGDYNDDRNLTIPLEIPSGFRYSYYRSDDPLLWSKENYQFGMNLPFDKALHRYEFTNPQFNVYNPSSIPIQPFEQMHDLVITIKAIGSPMIRNNTTGTEFAYTKTMKADDTLVLDGVDAKLNGEFCGQNTDLGVISLARGVNQFHVSGCTLTSIKFSFPFLYV